MPKSIYSIKHKAPLMFRVPNGYYWYLINDLDYYQPRTDCGVRWRKWVGSHTIIGVLTQYTPIGGVVEVIALGAHNTR